MCGLMMVEVVLSLILLEPLLDLMDFVVGPILSQDRVLAFL